MEANTSWGLDFKVTRGADRASRNFSLDAVNATIASLAVICNGMVFTVMVIRHHAFKSFTNRLILHQSVIDAIAGVVFFLHKVIKPVGITVSLQSNIYDQLVCRFMTSDYLLWSVNVASTYNLVIISLERLMATCYPVKYRNTWSRGMLKYAVGASWAIGFVYAAHMIIIYEPFNGRCRTVDMQLGVQVLVGATVVGMEYFIPIVIMVVSYTKILIMLRKKLLNPVIARQHNLAKAKKNVLMTVLLSGFLFVICWTPTEYDYLKELFFPELWDETVYIALTGLLACNMFINPIIYCLNYRHFRHQLNVLWRKGFRPNQVGDRSIPTVSTNILQQTFQEPVTA
ncbi:galanin receptor 2b-like [Asterias amurensis]|uniref:galanin receptor 2b-like n=1 Tax=Asterias amurensis TaxID=7602 RepID=UPI003AB1DF3C